MLTLLRSGQSITPSPYTPRTPALAPELGRVFAAQRHSRSREGDAQLRAVADALVRRLKDDGLPPERVIVAIKTAIVRYGDEHRAPSLATDDGGRLSADPVYGRLFQWILEAYFNDGSIG